MTINYSKYWSNGMGLHASQLRKIHKLIIENDIKTIVEFGSGLSTAFLVELREKYNYLYNIYSFDHNEKYAYNESHDFLKLEIRDLVQCSPDSYENAFVQKKYDRSLFENCQDAEKENFRAKNTFYDITSDDLPPNIDLVILDGPNGNGRSISYLHLLNKTSNNCYVVIDDAEHYDFVKRLEQVFDNVLIAFQDNDKSIHPLYSCVIAKIWNDK